MHHRFDSSLLSKENIPNTLTYLIDHAISLNDHARLLEKRIRELRSTLVNELTTTISSENINEQVKTSLPEHDSGLSENELYQTTVESIPSKSNQIIHPLSSSSDVESGINGDYSPNYKPSSSQFILQHQSSAETNDIPTLERIAFELNSIAVDWRSYHAPLHCTCASPFDSAQRKYNCWRCGENFCIRCIEHGIRLPGLYSNNLAPVCKTCTRLIKLPASLTDFSTSIKSNNRKQEEIKSSTSIIDQITEEKKILNYLFYNFSIMIMLFFFII